VNARRAWWRSHAYSLFSSLGRFVRAPLNHLLTLAVIAVALALPALSLTLLHNVQSLGAGISQTGDMNVFLKTGLGEDEALALRQELLPEPAIAQIAVKSPDAALAEFEALAEFSDAIAAIDSNPLPFILVLELKREASKPESTTPLLKKLRAIEQVDMVQFDQEWLARLKALIALVQRGVYVVGALLALAVVLIIGNTIRLEILTRRDEIVIMKLVGADDGFVRRPFVYTGFWFGFVGAVGASLLLMLAMTLLEPSVTDLAEAYGSGFRLLGPGIKGIASLLGVGILLGCLGALLASHRHLKEAEPS
jgi:cell division transport system permease protein